MSGDESLRRIAEIRFRAAIVQSIFGFRQVISHASRARRGTHPICDVPAGEHCPDQQHFETTRAKRISRSRKAVRSCDSGSTGTFARDIHSRAIGYPAAGGIETLPPRRGPPSVYARDAYKYEQTSGGGQTVRWPTSGQSRPLRETILFHF